MSRSQAREKYVELCRKYNQSSRTQDEDHARHFLEGVQAILGCEGHELFDFCVAGDEAATADGYESSCWGLKV